MSLDVLTHRLFDYAGMFPPAALSFDDAVQTSAGFINKLQRPSLVAADLVLTPPNLEKVTPEVLQDAGFQEGRPVTICKVGVPAADGPAAAEALLARNAVYRDDAVPHRVVALELHTDDPATDQDALAATAAALAPNDVALYFEPKWDDATWKERLPDALATWDALAAAGHTLGLKARCAGPTAVSHNTLARILAAASERRRPLKLTQGLHHPFPADPRYDNEHGFLNTAIALRLHQVHGLGHDDLVACLTDTDAGNFTLHDGLGWGHHRLMAQRARDAMTWVPLSIGSCSLDEPDADLAELGPAKGMGWSLLD
ncbi:MAG: hypothetical protein ACPGQL_00610 [Thermoplasmatota archaeon]